MTTVLASRSHSGLARRRVVAAIALAVVLPVGLAGCSKPTPGVTVVSGTTSEHRDAVCWSFEDVNVTDGACDQSMVDSAAADGQVAAIPVTPGDTVGISVDKAVAEVGWTPVIGTQKLTSQPLTTTYFRFTYPDLQEVPADGLLLQVVAGSGDITRGLWVFKLVPAGS